MATIRWEIVDRVIRAWAWSDRRLARELGFCPSHVCDVRSGRRKATIEFIDRLVEVTRIDYDRLLRHPSVKVEAPRDPRIGLTLTETGAKRRLCYDPEHYEDVGTYDQAKREREAAALIPRQTRWRLWPRRGIKNVK